MFEFVFYCGLILMGIAAVLITVRKFAPAFTMRAPSLNGKVAQWTGGIGRFMMTKGGKVTLIVVLYLIALALVLGILSKALSESIWNRMSSNSLFWFGILAILVAAILYYVHNRKEPLRTWTIRILLIFGIAGLLISASPHAPVYERSMTSNAVDGTYTLAPKTTMEIRTPLASDSFMLTPTKGDVWIAQVGRPTYLLKKGVTAVFGPNDVANAHSDDPQRDAAQIIVMSYKYKKIGECD